MWRDILLANQEEAAQPTAALPAKRWPALKQALQGNARRTRKTCSPWPAKPAANWLMGAQRKSKTNRQMFTTAFLTSPPWQRLRVKCCCLAPKASPTGSSCCPLSASAPPRCIRLAGLRRHAGHAGRPAPPWSAPHPRRSNRAAVAHYRAGRTHARRAQPRLFMGNAGTAMRPLTAALAVLGGQFEMTGHRAHVRTPDWRPGGCPAATGLPDRLPGQSRLPSAEIAHSHEFPHWH